MFIHTCTACEKRQLIFPSQLTGAARATDGLEVSFTCWCGQPQTAITERWAAERARETVAA